MATTTNYGWTTPDDTALVKDGAAAIRTLGSSVDTTTKALNPSTTLGDIEFRSSTANTNTRLGIGTTGQVLTVAGGVPSWATAGGGGMTVIASGSLSGSSVVLSSIPNTFNDLILITRNATHSSGGNMLMRFNGVSSSVYRTSSTYGNDNTFTLTTNLFPTGDVATTDDGNFVNIRIYDYANSTTRKLSDINSYTSVNSNIVNRLGVYAETTAITSITIFPESSATYTGGTYVLYGVK